MKNFILILSILAFIIWPLNFFRANPQLNLEPQTIFVQDYQGRQLILRNINLYPNVYLARLFQNKAVIVTNKYFNNLFNILDLNYYFFGSHPREVVGGLNYTRLPLLTILPILWFLFITQHPKKKTFLLSISIFILIISFFINHYVYDFILWPFFLLFIFYGLEDLIKINLNFSTIFSFCLLIETIYELAHLIS